MSRSRDRAKRVKRVAFENTRRMQCIHMMPRALVYPTTYPCGGCGGRGVVCHFGQAGVRDWLTGVNCIQCHICGGTGKVVPR